MASRRQEEMMKLLDYFRSIRSSAWRDEEGQTLTEYALLLALVALACVASLTALQGGLGGFYSSLVATLSSAFG
jgi:Flp pilus assembly pilin Flp